MDPSRRKFVKQIAVGAAGTSLLASQPFNAFSANETVNVAIIGLGGRSYALMQAISFCSNVKLVFASDVDALRQGEFLEKAKGVLGYKVKGKSDFRKILENKKVDAVFIVTPEHWHAPMAILAMQAGKHVYVEKPCSHNIFENDLLRQVQKKYDMVCQMGNQQRSSVSSNQAIKDIREGKIGEVYTAKAWYSNTRGTIGKGVETAVPDTLDWELWQGPAPRENYRDNVHPYNWHWFRTWGTGEIHNNGTHEIDICRWALGVDFPKRVVSAGGRFHFEDDWQFYDTQMASFEFEGGKSITWEGRSCNGLKHYGRGRGATIHGTEGTILLDRGGYQLFDLAGNEVSYIEEKNEGTSNDTADTSGFDGLTVRHIQNFIDVIRTGGELNADIQDASISTHLCHLGNIAQDLEVSLSVNSQDGVILDNDEANKLLKRKYEAGWEPKL